MRRVVVCLLEKELKGVVCFFDGDWKRREILGWCCSLMRENRLHNKNIKKADKKEAFFEAKDYEIESLILCDRLILGSRTKKSPR